MGEPSLIIGAGIVGFLCVYMLFKLGDKSRNTDNHHYGLQVIVLAMVVLCIFLIGKSVYDDRDNCDFLVSNSTESGDTTSYEYAYTCETNDNSTHSLFFRLNTWFVRIMGLYLLGYLVFSIGKMCHDWWQRRRGRV